VKNFLFRKIHASFVLVWLTAGVVLGVAGSFLFDFHIFISGIWVLVVLGLFLFAVICPRAIFMILALAAGGILGAWRADVDLTDAGYIGQFIGETVEVSGTVYEDPDVGEGKVSIRLNGLVFGEVREVRGSVFVQLSSRGGAGEIRRGDIVELSGKMSGGFGSFAGSMYRPSLKGISRPEPGDIGARIRDFFSELIRRFIPEPEVDLSLGYLLGARRALPESLTETLRIVGLTHIVVASGYNLSVLVRFSRKIFGKLSRFAALFFSLLLIGLFISITGFTPSMLRAGMVAVLSLIAWYVGRNFHPMKLLLLVAAATLLVNPYYIVDLGWILSIMSFAGVIIVAPLITAFFYGEGKPNAVARIVVETLAAQAVCLPVLLYFFGTFSLVSVVANVLIVPTIPAVMALTFATGICAFIPVLAEVFGFIATWILKFHIFVIDFFGARTEFLVSFAAGSLWTLGLYVPIVGFLVFARIKTGFSLRPVNVVA
jgi:competence protein ComEC